MNDIGRYKNWDVYHCNDCGSDFKMRNEPEKCPRCGSNNIEDSEDSRVCSHCGKLMSSGYVFDDGMAYYCSDECMHRHYSEEEYLDWYKDNAAFWTEWY